jgi:hypothetical protein
MPLQDMRADDGGGALQGVRDALGQAQVVAAVAIVIVEQILPRRFIWW